jgi:hypothetical protein
MGTTICLFPLGYANKVPTKMYNIQKPQTEEENKIY